MTTSSGGTAWSQAFAVAPTAAMQVYEDVLVPRLFNPWAELLLDELGVKAGDALLDVATGPGTVARIAAARLGPSGSVTACDLSPAMLEIARAKPSTSDSAPITYVECPADALSVPDDAFDFVTCQQGLQFFPDRPAAIREMRRAARSGGHVGIALWREIEEVPLFAAGGVAIAVVLGEEAAQIYRSGPWGFGDAEALGALLRDAGLSDVEVTRHELPLIFEGGPAQLLSTLAASSLAPRIAELGDDGPARLLAALEDALGGSNDGGPLQSTAAANIAVAHA